MFNFAYWVRKFSNAFHGIGLGMKGQKSFAIHLPMACAVVAIAWFLQCSLMEWLLLVLCIGFVIAMELINSAIEELAHALCPDHHPGVGRALDIASGAVLVASITSALIGGLIILHRLSFFWSGL